MPRENKKVDPKTGKPSTAANAILYKTWYGRRKVDPMTGKPSTGNNAIIYSNWLTKRHKVDPKTGKASTADDAIPYSTWKSRRKVDPKTGEQSTAADAIPYSTWSSKRRKIVKGRIELSTESIKSSDEFSIEESITAASSPPDPSMVRLVGSCGAPSPIFSQRSQLNIASSIDNVQPMSVTLHQGTQIESVTLPVTLKHVERQLIQLTQSRAEYSWLQAQYEALYEEYSQLAAIYQAQVSLPVDPYAFLAAVEFQPLPLLEEVQTAGSQTILKNLHGYLTYQEEECNVVKLTLRSEYDRLSTALQIFKNSFKNMKRRCT